MKLINPSKKLTLDFLQFISINAVRNQKLTKMNLFDHFDKTNWYMEESLEFLLIHGIVTKTAENLIIDKDKALVLENSESERLKVFLGAIGSSKPFIEYCHFLNQGHSIEDSIKLTIHLYKIDNTFSSLKKIFGSWIELIGIKVEDIQENKPKDLMQEASKNILLASTYIKNVLGDYYIQVPQSIQDDLNKSIQQAKENAEDSINSAGRALEDFLRLVVGKDENLSKCNGIGQIANEFNRNKTKYPSKLNNITMSIGGIRSMGSAHGVDKDFEASWIIEEGTAFSTIRLTLSVIKSYLVFEETGKLIF